MHRVDLVLVQEGHHMEKLQIVSGRVYMFRVTKQLFVWLEELFEMHQDLLFVGMPCYGLGQKYMLPLFLEQQTVQVRATVP
jgi:hypothetical protein